MKNYMILVEERGWDCKIEKSICSDCINDYALSTFIKKNHDSEYCNYCNKMKSSISLEKLLPKIMDGLMFRFDKSVNWLMYVSSEGGYQGVTYDVNDNSKEIILEWNQYSNKCKEGKIESHNIDKISIVNTVIDYIKATNNIVTIKSNTLLVHRAHEAHDNMPIDAKRLGTLPYEISIKNNRYNRFNTSKTPVFYGCDSRKGALLEIGNPHRSVTGIFSNIRDLKLLDLANVQTVSIFDELSRDELYYSSHFIFEFQNEISKPIEESVLEIEYKPTQIFFEYIKTKYPHIDGLIYRSSKNIANICYALLVKNEECIDYSNDDKTAKLKLVEVIE